MTDLITTTTTAAAKQFRFQHQRCMLTYKGHLPKEETTNYLKEEFSTPKVQIEVHMAHETGHEDTPYEHTHIYIDFGRCYNTRDCRRFDIANVHPHIKPVLSRTHLDHVWAYLCKEDHENDSLLERVGKSMADRVWRQPTLQDALRAVDNLCEVIPTIQLYNARPLPPVLVEAPEEWRPWQQKIIDMIEEEPNDRSIIWIEDERGGCGKSRLTRWLKANNKAEYIKYFGRTADFMTNVAASLERGWDGRCLICDLPRAAEKKNLYEPMESFKDGMVQTTKYVGKSLLIPHPHLIVMANFGPKLHKMTMDRWKIYRISETFDLEEHQLNIRKLVQGKRGPIEQ